MTPLYTLSEAAAALRVSPKTVHRMLDSGRLRGMRLGREWRFTPEQIRGTLTEQPVYAVEMPVATFGKSALRAIADGRARA